MIADTSIKLKWMDVVLGNFIQRIDTLLGADEDVNVNRERVRNVVDQARETMRSIQQLSDSANELVGDPQMRQRLRVGLGGRLDATNVLHPIASVITNIGLDHMEYLGPTLPRIAAEKGGIIKPGVPVVIGPADPDLPRHDRFALQPCERA